MAKKLHDVKDLKLADQGKKRIEWADQSMPVLRKVRERFAKEKPLKGITMARVPARHHRDRQPHAHAEGRRRQGVPLRLQPALDPGRHRRGAGQVRGAFPPSRSRARTTRPTTRICTRCSTNDRC